VVLYEMAGIRLVLVRDVFRGCARWAVGLTGKAVGWTSGLRVERELEPPLSSRV